MAQPTWEVAMAQYTGLSRLEQKLVRQEAIAKLERNISPGQGIGSSDLNHTIYGMICTGEFAELVENFRRAVTEIEYA